MQPGARRQSSASIAALCIWQRAFQTWRRDFRTDRSGAQRSLWRNDSSITIHRCGDNLQTRLRNARQHARHFSARRSRGAAGVSFPKPYADRVAKLRVPGGFILVAAFLWLSAPSLFSLELGLPVSILGLALRAWAAGHLEKIRRLPTEGRTPCTQPFVYWDAFNRGGTGDRVAPLGIGRPVRDSLPADLSSRGRARRTAPSQVVSRVRRLCAPRPQAVPTNFQRNSPKRFRWSIYLKNQEYQALLGFLAGAAVLVWKAAFI